jgi:hypothetical protein
MDTRRYCRIVEGRGKQQALDKEDEEVDDGWKVWRG